MMSERIDNIGKKDTASAKTWQRPRHGNGQDTAMAKGSAPAKGMASGRGINTLK
jgi:hypothetical protein